MFAFVIGKHTLYFILTTTESERMQDWKKGPKGKGWSKLRRREEREKEKWRW